MRKDSEIFLRKCLQYKTEIGEDAFELNITYFGEIPNIEVEIDEIINELKTLKCISKKSEIIGEITDAWIFVGILTYSQYAFVKAYMNEKTDNWIKAHVQMFDFFGGVTPMLVSDNCTTTVNHKKSDWYNTALNTTYHEMAEHYNLAILPAESGNPRINRM